MDPPSYNSLPKQDRIPIPDPPPYAAHYNDEYLPMPTIPDTHYQTNYPAYISGNNGVPGVHHQQPTIVQVPVVTETSAILCPQCQNYNVPFMENNCMSANGFLALIFCIIG